MKRLTALALLAAAYMSPTSAGETACEFKTIEQLAKQFVAEYPKKRLASLDAKRPYIDGVQVVIDHSITGEYEVEEVSSFEELERWLKSLEPQPGFPARETRPVLWCKKGLCVFDFNEGLKHNTLFPQKIIYSYKNGCPYVKTVFFWHGD
jgi:hypothetical protein